jgi:hypothetical protein
VQWAPGLFPEGKEAGAWRLPTTLSSAEVKEMSTATHLLSLWAFMVCSRLNLVCQYFNLLNAELISICHLLALLRTHPIFYVSRIRVKICNMLQWIRKKVIVALQEIFSHLLERTVESREDHRSSRYSGQDSK